MGGTASPEGATIMAAYPVNAEQVLGELLDFIEDNVDADTFDPEVEIANAADAGWLVDSDHAVLTFNGKAYLVRISEVRAL